MKQKSLSNSVVSAGDYLIASADVDCYTSRMKNEALLIKEGVPLLVVTPIGLGTKTFKFIYEEVVYEENCRFLTSGPPFLLVRLNGALAGQKICITGALTATRPMYDKLISLQNGELASSVSRNTAYLVTEHPNDLTTKLAKAKQYGIKIIGEDAFLNICGCEWVSNRL